MNLCDILNNDSQILGVKLSSKFMIIGSILEDNSFAEILSGGCPKYIPPLLKSFVIILMISYDHFETELE